MTEVFVDPIRQPYFSPVFIPTLPSLHLSQEEQGIISKLQMRAWRNRYWMQLTDSYYRGMQILTDLGISIPPELTGLRVIVGWPRIAVDPFVERLSVDGFRLRGATDTDQDLEDLWLGNNMDAEQGTAYTDALALGRSWLLCGAPLEPGGLPVMSVESPLNISASWDVRSAKPKELLQSYWLDDRRHAALYLLNETIYIGEDDDGIWQIVNRDQHNFGMITASRMANRPRSTERDGASEITPELMSITDQACRVLLSMSVAGEFYSVPQKIILGATEADFQNADGTPKSAWKTYVSNVLALERDEDGNVPSVQQFKAYDPSVFTKELEFLASQAAGIMGANPQDLGLYTQGNPTSADAMQVVEGRRDRRARLIQRNNGPAVIEHMQFGVRYMNNGELPKEFERMTVDWADPQIPNFTSTADGLAKLMAQGSLPPTSDVTLKRAGFNAIERARLEVDRQLDAGAQVLRELASSVQAKDARLDLTVARDINPATANPAPAQAPRANPPNVAPPVK